MEVPKHELELTEVEQDHQEEDEQTQFEVDLVRIHHSNNSYNVYGSLNGIDHVDVLMMTF